MEHQCLTHDHQPIESDVSSCTGQLMLDALIEMDTNTNDFTLANGQFQLFDNDQPSASTAFSSASESNRFSPNQFGSNNPFSADRSLDDFLANVENENLEYTI